MYRIIIILFVSSLFHSSDLLAETTKQCEKIREKYNAEFTKIISLKNTCKSDSECVLLFNTGFLTPGCDMGTPLPKNSASIVILKSLNQFKEEAAKICPEDRGPQCEAIPYSKVKCSKNVCTGQI